MDKKEIMSVWAAFQQVQEKKKAKLDPVGKEDGDVDNDGDEDSSDEYLANRRKKVGAAMKKEGKIPPQFAKKGEKGDDDDEESDEKSEKPKKGENPFAKKGKKEVEEGKLPPALQKAIDKKKGKKVDDDEDEKEVKESEESPYPTLDKKKREKKGSNLEDAGGPAAKLKGESVEKDGGTECPKCKGKGCKHCDGKGYHKEAFDLFSEAELDALAEKMKQPGDTGGKGEEFMSTSSPKEKKVMADHEAGSDKKYEDWEDTSEKDGSKAGRAVKSQSPVRRGESRKSEPMSKVKGS